MKYVSENMIEYNNEPLSGLLLWTSRKHNCLNQIKLSKLLAIIAKCKFVCKIYTKTIQKNVPYCILSYLSNFQEDILCMTKVILH